MGVRYNEVKGQHAREIVLLKSFPCCYGKCSFCNYIEDNSQDEEEMNRINAEALAEVSGKYGVLEVINSGSVFEIPKESLKKIRDLVYEKDIKIVYFEIFYSYLPQLAKLRAYFNEDKEVELRFRMGIESFNDHIRKDIYNKQIPMSPAILEKLSKEVYSVCLLIGTKGQTEDIIEEDIRLGLEYFQAVTINVFIENGTSVQRDPALVQWFVREKKDLFQDARCEILIDNKDLGVFEQ